MIHRGSVTKVEVDGMDPVALQDLWQQTIQFTNNDGVTGCAHCGGVWPIRNHLPRSRQTGRFWLTLYWRATGARPGPKAVNPAFCSISCGLRYELEHGGLTKPAEPPSIDGGAWHGYALRGEAGASLGLHVGPLPGRRSIGLYLDVGRPVGHPSGPTGLCHPIAYFKDPADARLALDLLDHLISRPAFGIDPTPTKAWVEFTIDQLRSRLDLERLVTTPAPEDADAHTTTG